MFGLSEIPDDILVRACAKNATKLFKKYGLTSKDLRIYKIWRYLTN